MCSQGICHVVILIQQYSTVVTVVVHAIRYAAFETNEGVVPTAQHAVCRRVPVSCVDHYYCREHT